MKCLHCPQVSKEELAKLVQGFDKQELLTSGGVTLAGQRYIYLSGTERVVRAKFGKVGVHCMKTQQGKNCHLPSSPQALLSESQFILFKIVSHHLQHYLDGKP